MPRAHQDERSPERTDSRRSGTPLQDRASSAPCVAPTRRSPTSSEATSFPSGFAVWVAISCLVANALGPSSPARAATDAPAAETQRLKSELLLDTTAGTADPLSQIWRDTLPALRSHLGARAPTFFAARFSAANTTIIVSVSADDPTCDNLSGALARPTAGRACPMRVAVITHGVVSIASRNDHFVFADPVDANGARLPPSPANETAIMFRADTHDLTFVQRIDGKSADGVNPTPIHLEY
jgi:hypothetical protein